MDIRLKICALALASASLLALQGCGGGGGNASSSAPAPAPAVVTVSGVAASGAAFTGATITVKDSTGATVGTNSSPVGADGNYSVTLSAGATAPFVIIATRISANGDSESLVSVVPTVSGTSATANVTPVTHLIASRLSPSGDPLKLATEVASSAATVNTTSVAARVTEVQAILAPVLTATGTTSTDPFTGTFSTDGTGYDRLLDSIKVTVIPASETSANIEVAIKQQQPEDAAPVMVQFASTATTAPSLADQTTASALTLLPSGAADRIAALLTQLNTCFALPVNQRVDTPDPASPTLTSHGQANVIAPACRAAFMQDGTGAIIYRHDGAQISAVTDRPFFGLFRDAATGTIFSQGSYEFSRNNGDIVISFKRDTAGAEVFGTLVLREDTADGNKLKLIGNQYNFPGSIVAYHQLRHFPTLNQSEWNYYSTGYNPNIPNVTNGSGNPIFHRVEVTTPRGVVLTLKPTSGSSYLVLIKNPGTGSEVYTGTSFVRLRSEYLDSTKDALDPKDKDVTMFHADRTVFTNTAISEIPMQAVWRFDYYLASDPTTIAATQHYRTRARALTIPELKTKGLAALTATYLGDLQSRANGSGVPMPGRVPAGGLTEIPIDYEVATGALPPTSLMVWGRYTAVTAYDRGFNDNTSVRSTARTGAITCSPASGQDLHCASGAGSAFVDSAVMDGMHLRAIEMSGREYATFYAMYALP